MSSIRSAFNQAANSYNQHASLQHEVATRLNQKLDVCSIQPQVILDLGAGTGLLSTQLAQRFKDAQLICLDFAQQSLRNNPSQHKVCANAQRLPLADNSVDLITSSLMMQWCDDLGQLFSECTRVLKDDGLMLFSTFGPDTLKELKKSWAVVDNEAHVNEFVDMHDIGDQLMQSGLQSPVMEMEMLTLTYETVVDLLKDLKFIGAQSVPKRSKTLTGKDKFKQMTAMYEHYRQDGKLPATYEVIYGHAWKGRAQLGAIKLDNQS